MTHDRAAGEPVTGARSAAGSADAPELVAARGRSTLVPGPGGPLTVYRSGMGAPVLLAHGLTASALQWHPVVPALARRYEVIAVDARGHGRSALPGTAADRPGYSARHHAADLVAVLDRLGIARASLVGQSMGAENVACCAARYPERVACVVLEDPPWWPLPQAARGARRAMRREWHAQLLAEQRLPDAELRAQRAGPAPDLAPALVEELLADRRRLAPAVLEWLVEREHWSRFVSEIVAPTLLLTGDLDQGAIVSPLVARQVQARNALVGSGCRVRVRQVAGAGHGIHDGRPREFLAAVLPFLAAHAGR